MKRLIIVLMTVALGAAVSSCQDEAYNEVENTVLEHDVQGTDSKERLEPKHYPMPGSAGSK